MFSFKKKKKNKHMELASGKLNPESRVNPASPSNWKFHSHTVFIDPTHGTSKGSQE